MHSGENKSPRRQQSRGPTTDLSAKTLSDCSTFLIVGAVLGSLLVVASVMMCVLSHRLYRVSRRYSKERLDEVVREHRRKFGQQESVAAGAGGRGGGGGLFRMQAAPAAAAGMPQHGRQHHHHHQQQHHRLGLGAGGGAAVLS